MSRHEAVKKAVVVIYNKEGNLSLVAYVTLATPIDEVAEFFRTWLEIRFPEYMLPARNCVN